MERKCNLLRKYNLFLSLPQKIAMIFTSYNPYNLEVLERYESHTPQAIENQIAKAFAVQQTWEKFSFAERATYFIALANYLRTHKTDLATLISLEMGKIITESLAEIEKCAGACEYFAEHTAHFLQAKEIPTDALKSGVSYEAAGVVFTIMPWNFPFWQVFRYAAAALMAGNVTILKHAPNVFGCALAIEKAFLAVGFPQGVFQSLICDTDTIPAIIADDRIAMVSFTGSEKAGSIVASLAGKNIKKCILELGGNDALIVCEDADLVQAAKVAMQSRMSNAGQVCIAAKRFLVAKNIKSAFIQHLMAWAETLKQGNPLSFGTKMGVLARMDLANTLENQLTLALQQGAHLLYGGKRENCWFEPTIIDNVSPENVAFTDETFGPLAAISSFDIEKEAIQLANHSRYGLSASIWTTDKDRAKQLLKQLKVGSVFVNSLVRSDYRLPIGGTKKSGFGRELSEIGIQDFCVPKTYFFAEYMQ